MKRGSELLLVLLLLVGGGGVLLYVFTPPGSEHVEDHTVVPQVTDTAAAGREAYEANCIECHGENGGGTDKGPPLVHHDYEPGHKSDDDFRAAIANGVKQELWSFGDMPAQPEVTPQQVEAIIAYVRELQAANSSGHDHDTEAEHDHDTDHAHDDDSGHEHDHDTGHEHDHDGDHAHDHDTDHAQDHDAGTE